MEKSVRIDGVDYQLFSFSNDGFNWNPRYLITSCSLGHISGRRPTDCGDGFFDIGAWKFIKPMPPEKPRKKKYRPYGHDAMKRLFQNSVKLTSMASQKEGCVTGYDVNKKAVFILDKWIDSELLMRLWLHEDGRPCCVEVADDEE